MTFGDDAWSLVKRGRGRQLKGQIRAPGRNAELPVETGHDNRAGHRAYVRALQTRQGRKNLVGFGRWRRQGHERSTWMSVLRAQRPYDMPRWMRRIEHGVIYRASRKARSTRITPK